MVSVHSTTAALTWAAGDIAGGAPDLPDHDELLFGLREHRLEGRMLARARRDGLAMPDSLASELARRHASYVDVMYSQQKLFARLREALQALRTDADVLCVKGYTLFALTGDENTVRRSADLDVMAEDPAALVQAALALSEEGYHYHGEEHPYVYAHMKDIEVHAWYLATGFPAGLPAADFDPGLHRGVLELPRSFQISRITFADLMANSAVPVVAGLPGRVLGPEMAALIRCAHLYVGYAMDPRPLPFATIRLDEVSQFGDLVALDSFDARRFSALVDRFNASLIVEFVVALWRELLHADPFARVGKQLTTANPAHEWYPQNLWWDGIDSGFPVHLGWQPDQLVARGDGYPDLVDLLSPMPVTVGADGTARVVLACDGGAAEGDRYIFHRFSGSTGPVEVEFATGPAGIRTTVTTAATRDDEMSGLGLASGDTRVELFYKPREDEHDYADYSGEKVPAELVTHTAQVVDGKHVLVVELPWRAFGRSGSPARGESVPMILRVRHQRRPWLEVTGGVVAPLSLRFGA